MKPGYTGHVPRAFNAQEHVPGFSGMFSVVICICQNISHYKKLKFLLVLTWTVRKTMNQSILSTRVIFIALQRQKRVNSRAPQWPWSIQTPMAPRRQSHCSSICLSSAILYSPSFLNSQQDFGQRWSSKQGLRRSLKKGSVCGECGFVYETWKWKASIT